MKKKLLSLALVVAMIAIIAVGSMAYFTDSEGTVNTMTTGNVKITQNEQERNAEGALVKFEQKQKLIPYTGSVGTNGVANEWGASAVINGTEYKMFDQSKNAIDKIVTVTNEGTEDAYIRTLFFFEVPEGNEDFLYDRTLNLVADPGLYGFDCTDRIVTYGGTKFVVCEYYYNNDSMLPAGETSHPSLRQVYLNANIDNEWNDAIGKDGTYDIFVLSQATQAQGFDDAVTALDTAFGDVSTVDESVLKDWMGDCIEIIIDFGF